MTFPAFFKRKSTYIVLVILALGGAWYVRSRSASNTPAYETAPVVRQDLAQTVEVTGEIMPAARIDLSFKSNGTLGKINVKIGDTVKQGDVLAELKAEDLAFAEKNAEAALATAQANLNVRVAGETKQSIQVAQASVEQAQASYDKAQADLESTQRTTQDALNSAQIALQTAQNNLDNQGAIANQNVQNAYDSARSSMLTALGSLNTGLSDGDQISGVDNTAASQLYGNVLGFLDAGSLDQAKASYIAAKTAKLSAQTLVNGLSSSSTKADIQNAATVLQGAITLMQTYLTDVQHVLASSLTNAYLTTTTLAAQKTTIDADRTNVSAQNTSILGALQAIKNAELASTQSGQSLQDAFQTAQTAYDTAKTNADVNVRTAQTNVAIQKAALDSAKAALDLKQSPPREVDLAPLRASVLQAQVALDKAKNDLLDAQIIAPVNGTISDVLPSVGEEMSMNVPEIKLIGTESYDIEAEVPEADITKISVGQTASITLDAYGDDVKFTGTVTAKDPDQTVVQQAIYYKIRVAIDAAGHELKPGMTANVTVHTGDRKNVLVIPLRAIRTDATTQQKSVQTLVNGKAVVHNVEIGLKGDEGRVEITSGLTEGDQVIVGEKATGLQAN